MKSYIDTFRKENIVYKLLTLGIAAVILFFLGRIILNTVNGYGFPKEVLEPASVNFTRTLIEGNNPYVRANIVAPGQEPPVNYEYPFLNNIFAAAFAGLLGNNVLAGHYVVSFLAMLGTAFIGASIINRYSRTTVGPALGFLLLLFCNWRYGYVSACPDGFGLFVTMLTVAAVLSPDIKKRALWCSICTVAAFYSKQYFAGICISIFLFMLCYSYKEALKYMGWCVVVLTASVAIVNMFWPLYWDYSLLFLMQGCLKGVNLDGILYVLEQLRYLAVVFVGLIAVVVFYGARALVKSKKAENTTDSDKNSSANETEATKRKLVNEADAVWFLIIQLPVQILVLFVFGRNDGAYLTYFLQLLIPSVAMLAMILMEKMEAGRFEWIYMGAYAFLIAASVVFGLGKLPMHMITEEEIGNWHKAEELLAQYREKGDIYHFQATAYNAAANGDSLYCTGHDGDIGRRGYEEWKSSRLQQILFPDAGAVFEENLTYRDVMSQKIVDREMAMITMPACSVPYTSQEKLSEAGFEKIAVIPLQMGNVMQEIEFWAVQ